MSKAAFTLAVTFQHAFYIVHYLYLLASVFSVVTERF